MPGCGRVPKFLASSCEDCKHAVVKDTENWPNRFYCTACLPDEVTVINDVPGSRGYVGDLYAAQWCAAEWRKKDSKYDTYTAPSKKGKSKEKGHKNTNKKERAAKTVQ